MTKTDRKIVIQSYIVFAFFVNRIENGYLGKVAL